MSFVLAIGLAIASQGQTLDPNQVADKLRDRLQKIESFSVDAELRFKKGKGWTASIQALRPHYFLVKNPNQWFIGVGDQVTQYMVLQSEYMRMKGSSDGMRIPLAEGFSLFSPASVRKDNYTKAEEVMFEGKKAIVLTNEIKGAQTVTFRTFIDPETYLPVGAEQDFMGNVDTTVYKNIKVNIGLKPADFDWTPPKGVVDVATKPKTPAKFLEIGQVAPNFNVTLADGRKVTLDEALKGKKALLVNFWFINCGYCLLEMPEFESLYEATKDKGLGLLALNDTDTKEEVATFLSKMKYRFPIGLDTGAKVAKDYLVNDKGHPVSYLIDSNRKVTYVQYGFDTEKKLEKLEAELTKLGVTR
jgi:peroxiredoxin/outer membrane lipoprotein-sorting protein